MKYFTSVLLLVSHLCMGQAVYQARVVDATTNEPLPFVNVGIVGQNIGTVTDDAGRFRITLEYQYANDSVKVSMIGYDSKSWTVDYLLDHINDSTIKLNKANNQIKLVEINSDKLRPKVVGSTTTSPFFTGGFTSNDLGNEICVKINVGKRPFYLQEFTFNIASNNCDSLLFRINVYSLKNDLPDQSLLSENLIIATKITSGQITVDLKPYELLIDEDFAIGLEYIKPCNERSLRFSAAFLGSIYSRTTSQGNWEKLKGFDLGFNVKVLY
jgi:hypothetical protein